MRPNTGALRTPVRSEGFVVLFPPPEGALVCAGAELAMAGVELAPVAALEGLSEARIHRIRCFRLVLAAQVSLSPRDDVILVICGESAGRGALVVDGAQAGADVVLAGGPDRLLLVLPRAILAPLAKRHLPGAPPMAQWPRQACLGRPGSAFEILIAYLRRVIAECPERIEGGEMGAQLEESLAMELLRNWVQEGDSPSVAPRASAVPRHVRLAQSYMAAHAATSPTMTEVARAAGVSERVLSAGFRQFRGTTPSAYLRELRLNGVRAALETAARGETVASIAASWSYVNFGLFARAYANRFGELPSATLRRAAEGRST